MGLIFDIRAAQLYESWSQSLHGRALDRWIEDSISYLIDPRPGERVLDIGCGSGNHLIFFNKKGLDLNGLDASPYMISQAKARLGNRCDLKIGRAENLPYEDNEFDIAVLINTLEFLDSPIQAIKEAGRVARKRIFIGVVNSLSCCTIRRKFFGFFQESFFNQIQSYNLWELKSLVQEALGNVPMQWHCAQMHPPFTGKIAGVLSGLQRGMVHWPFGLFFTLSADIKYTMRAESHPLRKSIKKTGHSIVNSVTRESLIESKETSHRERSGLISKRG